MFCSRQHRARLAKRCGQQDAHVGRNFGCWQPKAFGWLGACVNSMSEWDSNWTVGDIAYAVAVAVAPTASPTAAPTARGSLYTLYNFQKGMVSCTPV